MKTTRLELDRRKWLTGTIALASASSLNCWAGMNQERRPKNKICAFIKFIQSLSYDELADRVAEMGFDGIEATVRKNGYVLPEQVEDELPKLVEALHQRKLEITVMTSDVNRVDQPLTEKVLRTAAALGVKRYRMGSFRYDLSRPVLDQLREIRPALKELVAMNRELGISAVYQNHSARRTVGAAVWDLHRLIQDYPVRDIGIAFDIRHATVEGGLAWPAHFNLMRPHLGAVYVKDFVWDGRKPKNVPLGEGQVDPKFFELLVESGYQGPISLHVEYLHHAGTQPNVQALATDLKKLQGLLRK